MGLGSDRVAISVHKDYADYSNFKKEVSEEWKEIMTVTDSFVISLVSDSMLRNLTFKHLAELLKKEHVQEKT